MELWQSSTDENGNLYLQYRCSCGYQDSNVSMYKEPDEYKEPEQPKGKPSKVNKYD
jgi:hypothetical protein